MSRTNKTVTIVTGLPRSGTSMMMKMLEAGGLPPLVDGLRVANEDNPRGYYEYEPVKRTKEDPSWLEQAGSKVVKMVYRLIYDLPKDYDYHLIYMRRRMDEILASQEAMLRRENRWSDEISDEVMGRLYNSELKKFDAWLIGQKSIRVSQVWFNDLMQNAPTVLQSLNEDLGGILNVGEMLQVIDPTLYRNRRQ